MRQPLHLGLLPPFGDVFDRISKGKGACGDALVRSGSRYPDQMGVLLRCQSSGNLKDFASVRAGVEKNGKFLEQV